MQFNIRKLKVSDLDTLKAWWAAYPDWGAPPVDMLPGNGTTGFIVEHKQTPVVAGFIYFTNAKVSWLEWIISNPTFKNKKEAIFLLINTIEQVLKEKQTKYVFSICRNKNLKKYFKELGYHVDDKPSYEIIKTI